MRTCPHCGEEAMSGLAKAFLGTARSPKCKRCGKKVSVAKWSLVPELLVIIPPVVWAALTRFKELTPLLVTVAAAVVMTWFHVVKVPLEKRE